jgi:adenylate cyclase class IV
MSNEYELKFLGIEKDSMRQHLTQNGFSQTRAEVLMKRQTFHLPKNHPEHESKWGRVRDEGDKVTATVKWYEDPARPSISQVHEEEVKIPSWDDGVKWISAKGFTPTAYQENTREVWKKKGEEGVEVTIDTWPGLKPYVEIEAGSEAKVKAVAQSLGFDPNTGIAGGTEIVYEIEAGIPAKILKSLPSITFENPPSAKGPDIAN